MTYRTIVKPKRYNFDISHHSKVLLIGSCFSENIGSKLLSSKFNTLINPYGILFNPISITNALTSIVEEKEFTKGDLILDNGLYHSFVHHGKFSGTEIENVLRSINKSREEASLFLSNTDVLVITCGSAWVYRYNKTKKIVANCHKVPNREFTKELLSIEKIVTEFSSLITSLKGINPKLKIVLTISPVRHWKDGAIENNLSKSTLNVAVHQLTSQIKDVYYFPAYEMVIDDLRDYRFFKEDMLHPNDVAIDYVWNGFKQSFFSKETEKLIAEINKINKAIYHKPFNMESAEHQFFLKSQMDKINEMKKQFNFLNFDNELHLIDNQTI